MGFLHNVFPALNIRNLVEPGLLDYIKDYTLSHIPLILQLNESIPQSIEKKLYRFGAKDILYFPIINGFYMEFPKVKIKDILNTPFIKYISFNHRTFSLANNSPGTPKSYRPNVFGKTGKNITIAHLSTGIVPHKDLTYPRNRIIYFKDFINNNQSLYDDNGCGTHLAGCIAGNGMLSDKKYSGIASDSLLIGLKCLNEVGNGDVRVTLEALQWVLDHHKEYKIRIVHLPLGLNLPFQIKEDPLVKAVDKLWAEGLVVICPAGNNGPRKASISSPAYSKSVISIGCSNNTSSLDSSNFSSRGPILGGIHKPDLLAPGLGTISINYRSQMQEEAHYISLSGTSVSSSIVAGAVALLLEKYPDLDPEEVKLALELSSQSLHLNKNIQGAGLLDIEKLLSMDLR